MLFAQKDILKTNVGLLITFKSSNWIVVRWAVCITAGKDSSSNCQIVSRYWLQTRILKRGDNVSVLSLTLWQGYKCKYGLLDYLQSTIGWSLNLRSHASRSPLYHDISKLQSSLMLAGTTVCPIHSNPRPKSPLWYPMSWNLMVTLLRTTVSVNSTWKCVALLRVQYSLQHLRFIYIQESSSIQDSFTFVQ